MGYESWLPSIPQGFACGGRGGGEEGGVEYRGVEETRVSPTNVGEKYVSW